MELKKLALPATLFVLTLPLTACAPTTVSSGGTSPTYCQIARPFYWSTKDTDETIKQAKEQNAQGKALCEWGRK